jgi:monothiol glutaredoxin
MSNPVFEIIQKTLSEHDVVLYMKGDADMPLCGFSSRVVQMLDHLGVSYKDINVLSDSAVREGIKEFNNWPTIPQLFIKGEFVGGCDIITEMFQTGELKDLLIQKSVPLTV